MTTHAEPLYVSVVTPPKNGRYSPLFLVWMTGLIGALGIGLVSGLHVLLNGLGVTNLTNALPWGLWITLDLSAIALGAGAFTLSAAVYIFGMKQYEAIARAAVLVGLLGYSSAMLALFIDIGRPDRFYHPIIYWNVHSVLWEITMCVVLYSSVLVMELVPIIIESTFLRKYKLAQRLSHRLHSLMPLAAVFGMGLSLLHQSSLGATYGILTARPIWYSPSAPVLFILSAVAAGAALTLLVTLLTGKLLHKEMVPSNIITGVARLVGFACLAYLYLKLWSWAATSYYSHVPDRALGVEILDANTPYNFTFWFGEVLFGALVPAIIMLWGRMRRNHNILMLGAFMIIAGLVINRWNVTLSGFVIPMDWSPGVRDVFPINTYSPALVEWGVAIGIVAYSWTAFTLGVRFLNLYPEVHSLRRRAMSVVDVPPISEPIIETPIVATHMGEVNPEEPIMAMPPPDIAPTIDETPPDEGDETQKS
ncbi:MAG: NrfD/PsrC family molybdoenzyme membrane anchor subunit [Phototrophicales bacterium]|nr:NrfD/PsrC family molybdoenzyme membrane anchor subunit [Phototrophicales bacterium]